MDLPKTASPSKLTIETVLQLLSVDDIDLLFERLVKGSKYYLYSEYTFPVDHHDPEDTLTSINLIRGNNLEEALWNVFSQDSNIANTMVFHNLFTWSDLDKLAKHYGCQPDKLYGKITNKDDIEVIKSIIPEEEIKRVLEKKVLNQYIYFRKLSSFF